MADVRDAIDAGASPECRALAQRWLAPFRSYARGDPATQSKFQPALMNESELMAGTWADETLLGFVHEAMRHLTQPH
ncbi:hypothetical protein WS71_21755 [Burkholderia mayonis]|uniref:Uncharacterized protein n=1 Tax=Burkholderia mayonis TaxID=1385591 RepID=A0A1B4G1W2_9BURK|nr:hypothetical protein WS71_21755 [Burkholderia mayonis]KVE46967.1 hypothetical protein WS71_19955 [Burkholderia mayonis]